MQEFWGFAGRCYARPGVAPCCVALQDEHGVNVMLLLYICWRAAGGECVRGAALHRAMARLELIERHLLRPLRAARRATRRAAEALGSPALGAGADRLVHAELAAERCQAALLAAPAPAGRAPHGAGSARACATESLTACLVACGVAPARARIEGVRLAALALDC
ncbi:MAG: TIGR02444 family protein [Pseudomonadales bacterium]|nr:TIGR02444 family protein [Pseudomonadales bacterium]MBP9032857.1 TIGR02444 family protein [Pseudomonadales bacterium]